MKITEPKTPYVKYDAETDTVMDLDSKHKTSSAHLTQAKLSPDSAVACLYRDPWL